MQPATVDTDLLELEKQFWDAMKTKDTSVAVRLSADPCVVVGPQGIGAIDAKAMAGMLQASPFELKRYTFDEKNIHIRSVAKDVAVIAYKVSEDLVVDGKPTRIEAFDSSVWVRRNGSWVCAVHTETLAGDPYGRDRVAAKGAART